MKTDIVLCGVGGQGILSVAAVLDRAAMAAGYDVRQPEVHGMAQRGGAVHAFVRISDTPIACDLPPMGAADLILSVEPMEALRYTAALRPEGTIVTDVTPVANIPDYPNQAALFNALFALPRVVALDATRLARKAGSTRAQNMVVLGAASGLLPFAPELFEAYIAEMFARKGDAIVRTNLDAFRMGRAAAILYDKLVASGAQPSAVARVLPRLDLGPTPVPDEVVGAWKAFFARPDAALRAEALFAEGTVLPLEPQAVGRASFRSPSGHFAAA